MSLIKKSSDRNGLEGSVAHTWSGMTAGALGEPVELSSMVSINVQVLGELGTGKVVIQGSNVKAPGETDWACAVDRSGFPVEFITADNFKTLESIPRWLRPFAFGDDTMQVNVIALVREPT